MSLLEVRELKKYFSVKKGLFSKEVAQVKAVDGVSFKLEQGETLGLVGESGCGKTTVGRTLMRFVEPTDGRVFFEGQEVFQMGPSAMRQLRSSMQIVFQDPYSSLNPRMSVGNIIAEPIQNHLSLTKVEVRIRVKELMEKVGLHPGHVTRYPHEFSGGQRQRIGIARALALNPSLIICDEPVSALDVSIQAQVINLLVRLQREENISFLFIAHDLSVVEHISHRVAIMYLGRIVELASDKEIYERPLHPYTQALLSAVPIPDPGRKTKRIILQGDVPSPLNPPMGCNFNTRCPFAKDICFQEDPPLRQQEKGHLAACHLLN
ncbi:ABC transporter ATP-binding protein [Dethiosulfatarculus sandiegensis]|uniref:Peptide ABC transporter substrate-binding protein n=1 Tax=Dethiosulfatarculus sandiegensis TaxID=1429043 RepID=A0A0D2J667_9BACT|nr:dipeptide ABC transporter ATP-binding protein [Dethiosulfatarculus sandiegensis]KIX13634.1 peptide ABC transporter substrate-binding protein [Dethiosulfatarculus sandiegensis]